MHTLSFPLPVWAESVGRWPGGIERKTYDRPTTTTSLWNVINCARCVNCVPLDRAAEVHAESTRYTRIRPIPETVVIKRFSVREIRRAHSDEDHTISASSSAQAHKLSDCLRGPNMVAPFAIVQQILLRTVTVRIYDNFNAIGIKLQLFVEVMFYHPIFLLFTLTM